MTVAGMPRGPLTGSQAVLSVLISALVGGAAGLILRSRWAMLVAPIVFWTAVEIGRIRLRGPSVDAPHTSAFGLIALLSGRGVHMLLSVVPMTLAAAYGAARTRKSRPRGMPARLRQIVVAVLSIGTLALTAAAALPPSTPARAGGVAQLTTIESDGYGIGVLLRGASPDLPVLLIVPGPPGGSETGAVRRSLAALEQRFIVATMDRRGGGASSSALDARPQLSVDTEVADVLAVADDLRRRFTEDKIVLVGHSGGSIIGVLAVQRHPDRFRAYVGTGQAVDLPETDRIAYADLLAWARRTGRDDLAAQVARRGPPPYRDVYDYEPIMLYQQQVYAQRDAGFVIGVPEYPLLQKAHTLTAILDAWSALYPQMQTIDLRRDVPRLDVPVYFVQGGAEMHSMVDLFAAWYRDLQAPAKQLVTVSGAGHRVMFEEPGQFADVMTKVLDETAPS